MPLKAGRGLKVLASNTCSSSRPSALACTTKVLRSALMEPPLPLRGEATHWDHRADDDHYMQPGALFRLMGAGGQQRLFDNTARSIAGASAEVQQRHIDHCMRADPAYGLGVAQALQRLGRLQR